MPEETVQTVRAHLIGNPFGGELDDPWTSGHPAVGERVALFAAEVGAVDGVREHQRTFHAVPAERATTGPVGPTTGEQQGVSLRWWGCGTALVVGAPGGEPRACAVRADDPALLDTDA